MIDHIHADDRVTVACPGCITEVRAAEKAARWAEAPVRTCTVRASYNVGSDVEHLMFDVEVGVPVGATWREIEAEYAAVIGEAFVMALPETVDLDDTVVALETMEFDLIDVGAIIPDTDPAAVVDPAPSLFEAVS